MRTIWVNGRVWTGAGGFVSAFAAEDGRFIWTGDTEEAQALLRPEDQWVDLNGAFVSPGFNDSHMHLLGYGGRLSVLDLSGHTGSLQELLEAVRAYIEEHPPKAGGWIRGRGWNQDYFQDVRRMPTRWDLDEISADIPIVITRACGHVLTANSKALELAGITAGTISPEGGQIGQENGVPDGRLMDMAMDLLPTETPDISAIKDLIRLAMKELNRHGITSVQTDDFCAFRDVPFETVLQAYRELEAAGEMTVRVYEQANFTDLEGLRAFSDAGCNTGAGTEIFKIGPLKLLGDGSLGGRTAHLSRPYWDAPDERGFNLFSDEHMREMVSFAHERGMQIAVHAIGDACLDQVLDAFELALKANPRKDHRHGIVHCQITRPEQLKRIRDLGCIVYAQSIFLDYDNHIVADRVGPELAGSSYSWKTLMRMGVPVSNGSDCPVELPDVMEGMQCAVTRTSLDGTGPYLPDEAFTVEEALLSFTAAGAVSSFEEQIKGRIAPGMLADFTVLERDPFTTDPQDIHNITITSTWLGGRRVYG